MRIAWRIGRRCLCRGFAAIGAPDGAGAAAAGAGAAGAGAAGAVGDDGVIGAF